MDLDDQERTRAFLLSPETDPVKIEQAIRSRIKWDSDREAFKKDMDADPKRQWLMRRVQAIHDANIKEIIITDQDTIYKRFMASRPHLVPRHQRDISRILSLIKAHALLNLWSREKRGDDTIIATQEDIDAGFKLYEQVSESNELGLSPALFDLYNIVISPLLSESENGIERKQVLAKYNEVYGRTLSERKLRLEVLPALESPGMIYEQPDPNDKRRMLIYTVPRTMLSKIHPEAPTPTVLPPANNSTSQPNTVTSG